MKLLLQRDQKKGRFGGKITFTLHAQAELTKEESENVKTYDMGKTMLYTNLEDRGSGVLGAISRAASGIEITVNDLINGREVDCKDIIQMMAVEEEIKQACSTFKNMLDTATRFGGEEIVEF